MACPALRRCTLAQQICLPSPVPLQIWVLCPVPGEWMLPSRSHAPSPAPPQVSGSGTSDQGRDLCFSAGSSSQGLLLLFPLLACRSRALQKIRPSSWWSACPLPALKTRCHKTTRHRPIALSHTFVSSSGHLFLALSVTISQLRTQ